MITVDHIGDYLERLAPLAVAAQWDNVGLLVGDRAAAVSRLMTCLTITPAVAAEAIRQRAQLIVTHHPLPFRPLKRLTADEPTGRILLELVRAGVAIYSAHTAFDSAANGINQQLAEGLGLTEVQPLIAAGSGPAEVGSGRMGRVPSPCTLSQLAEQTKQFLKINQLQLVGSSDTTISSVAIGCGSAGDFLDAAIARGCQAFITGETRLHTCYDAEARGMALVLTGHYASERFGVERLAELLAREFAEVTVWPSHDERDPLRWA
jgi:dinuclear metal center YbgI/SA1388 family protein